MSLRVEIWSRPGSVTFEKLVNTKSLGYTQATGTVRLSGSGSPVVHLPRSFARLDEIIARDPANPGTDLKTIGRVYDDDSPTPDVPVDEFFVDDVTDDLSGPENIIQSYGNMRRLMSFGTVEAWDWAGSATEISVNPDWIYGGRNLLPPLGLGDLGSIREEWTLYLSGERYTLDLSGATSGTFTITAAGDTTAAIAFNASHSAIKSALEATSGVTTVSVVQADPDVNTFTVVFENPKDLGSNATANFGALGGTGTFTKLNDGFNTGANPTFTITVDGQTTTALAWDSTANQVEGSTLTGTGLQALSNVNDVRVSGTGIASDPWTITFYDPPDPTTVTVTFAAGTAVLTKIAEGDPDPSPITVSQTVDATIDTGIHGCDPDISVVTTPVDTGADWSLQVDATCRFDGTQIVLSGVKPGQLYQASIRVRPTVSGQYTLVIRDEFENFIANTTPRNFPLSAGSFQTLSVPNIQIPEGVTKIIMRVAVVDADPSAWATFYVNWQGALFTEGQPATTLGAMVTDIITDLTVSHVSDGLIFWEDEANPGTTYLSLDFTDTLDSAGNAWADAELGWTWKRGINLEQALDQVAGELGYEWTVVADPAAPDSGVYLLQIWNNAGRGTDLTADDHPAITLGQGITAGPVAKRHVGANRWMVEGDGGIISRAESSASVGAIGRIGSYLGDRTLRDETTAALAANRQVAQSLLAGLSIEINTTGEGTSIPLRDFGVGDTVNVTIPGVVARSAHRVTTIVYTIEAGALTRYSVQFSSDQWGSAGSSASVGGGGGGVSPRQFAVTAEAGRRYLAEFRGLDDPPVGLSAPVAGGGGGAPTIVVAAFDATDASKAKADFICSGDGDQVVLNQAIDVLKATFPETGRLLLTEGQFVVTDQITPFDGTVQGMGSFATIVVASGLSASSPIFELIGSGAMIHDLTIEGSGIGVASNGVYHRIDNVYFGTTGTAAIQMDSSSSVVSRCIFDDPTDPGTAIWCSSNVFFLSVIDNYFQSAGELVLCDGNLFESVIRGNICEFSGSASGPPLVDVSSGSAVAVVISGNEFTGGSPGSILLGAAAASLSSDCSIVGNIIGSSGDGIVLTNIEDTTVGDNTIAAQRNGVVLTDTTRCVVSANRIGVGSHSTTDTFDVVQISGDRNMVQGNLLSPSLSANLTRYGVNVISGTFNMVVGNDLGDPSAYGTDALNDAGMNTQLTYPNDVTYGDNFT